MATAHDELLQQLLTLPPDDRARLAEQLLESLEKNGRAKYGVVG
jgi:predicted transposase YdaD